MGNKAIFGIIIAVVVIGGAIYYFTRKKADIPPEEIEMMEMSAATEEAAGGMLQRQMDGFERRAVQFRKQMQNLTARDPLPMGLKRNIYAFTEDVRTLDAGLADKYYAEFCEGRERAYREPSRPVSKRSRSRSPQTAPLDTDMRDNADSAFSGFTLRPGQFVLSHEKEARSFSEFASTFDSSQDTKRARRNPENTQEKTRVDENNSGFDASLTQNNRDDTGMSEAALSGYIFSFFCSWYVKFYENSRS